MIRDEASERQIQASNPADSVWVSANAGSGKTRVLTDRVARLLLSGVEPQHILCLTYTKAAATEMQNRLFALLGKWAMKPDAALRADLAKLGEEQAHAPTTLARARQLFARAIETPGGLRIQTIHSFCATLLRRFPLEAGVSPQFKEMDDRAAKLMRDQIIEELTAFRAPALMEAVALAYSGEDFSGLMQEVAGKRVGFGAAMTPDQAGAALGLRPDDSLDKLLTDTLLGAELTLAQRVQPILAAGLKSDIAMAEKLAALDPQAEPLRLALAMEKVFLTQAGTKLKVAPTKGTRAKLAELFEPLDQLMDRIEAFRLGRFALQAVQKTLLLHRFAEAFLPLYEEAKASRGLLDFDDLILRAKALLTDQGVAAWVLFRLDGGIDHILVDEAQDTGPEQWQVIELLAAEFSAGEGTRDVPRTLFVVGDKKQSIYSFQGANVAAYDEKAASFKAKFQAAQQSFVPLELQHSFRSSSAILRVVDDTFGDRFPAALGHQVSHRAFHEGLPGRVDLWPLIPKSEDPEDGDWEDPVDRISETHHTARLAREIAGKIKEMIESGTQIPVSAESARPVHAGDFLILVQRRSPLFNEIIRACKQLQLPIAGADRLKLGAEMAVKDLTALLAFLATPEDDLSLAALLRSPLFGWTEAELYDLAQGRKGFLWEALRQRSDHPETRAMLGDLRDQADFLRPFDLIERALTRHDGRRRLLVRLGPEAEDGIDEFLSQALAFESSEIPSLTGFLHWLETDEIVVKRQTESEGKRIRVMTVHGAKGLEAPIVILPDTANYTPPDHDEIYQSAEGVPLWKTAADEAPAVLTAVKALRNLKTGEERLRLLYVALTRARVWLIVCGAGQATSEDCWYRLVEQGMLAAGTEQIEGGVIRHSSGAWPEALRPESVSMAEAAALPLWADRPAPLTLKAVQTLSPSDLGGAKVMPGEVDGSGEETAKARGTLLHALLEHLPRAAPSEWPAIAGTLIEDEAQCTALLAEASAVLSHPELASLFAPEALAEVGFSILYEGRPIRGTIDLLQVSTAEVLAVDFKSNYRVPDQAADTPEGILRQLGAYDAALQQIYPDKAVQTAVLWTRGPKLMRIDPNIVRAAFARSTIP
jgi:ATP-dependent helicase/nuclease subunit A